MPVRTLTTEELQAVAREYEMTLSDAEAAEYLPHVLGTLDAYAALDDLDEPDAVPPARDPGHAPESTENPVNGWSWRCSIKERLDGPLAGRTVAIKENTAIAGLPMRLGSAIMGDYIADFDATVVRRLLEAGAEIIGKTAVPALCFDGGGFVGGFDPPVLNPADHTRLPGGSSSGSAAVVANGEVDLALGGDQGGSIRLPASFSGCCGHKPTYGLVPYTGIVPLERTLDHTGPMARSVADCAAMLDVIAGPDGIDPRQPGVSIAPTLPEVDKGVNGLRVGILAEGFGIADVSEPEVDDAVRAAAEALGRVGAAVRTVSVPLHLNGLAIWNAIVVQGCADLVFRGDGVGTNAGAAHSAEFVDFFARAWRDNADLLPPTVKLTLLAAEHVRRTANHGYYIKGQNLARRLRAAYDEALADVDVIVMPTTAMRAFERPAPQASLDEIFPVALGNLQNTAPFDATGHPALSIPVPDCPGLPIGFQIVGRHFDDATVFRVAQAVERL